MASPTKIPASRLQIRQGTLVLSFPMLPPLSGLLMDLSELGCRGALALDQLEPAVAAEWQKTLSPKRPMHIRLDVPPYLQEFEIDGAVVLVDANGGRPEVDFAFHHTAPANRNILAQAVLTLATERVRQAGVQRSIAAGAAHLSSASAVRPAPVIPQAPAAGPNAAGTAVPRRSASGRNAAQSAKSASKPFEMHAPPLQAQPARPPSAHAPAPARTQVPIPPQASAPGPRLIPVPLSAPIPIRPPAPEPSAPEPLGHITRSGPGHISRSEPRSMPPMDSPPPADLPESGWVELAPEIIPAPDVPPQTPREHDSAILKNPQLVRAAATLPTEGSVVPSTQENQLLRVKRVGEVLVHMGRLNAEQVSVAVQQSRANGERLGRYLLRTGLVSADALCRALALQTGLPMTDLSDATIPENLGRIFPHEMMMQYSFVPFDEAKSFVCIAVADPLPQPTVRDLEKLCGKRIEVFLGQEDLVIRLLDKARGKQKRKLRRHIRYELSALARYQFCSRLGNPAEDVIHHGTTMNVSEGGFLIEGTPTVLGSPDDLRRRGICARVVLTGTFQEISALCHLRSIRAKERQEAGKARWLLGVEVAEISADDRRRLKELCLKAVAEKIKEDEE